jgi:uncharacterized protein
MCLSLYEISVPVMIAQLGHLGSVLQKGRVYADAEKITHAEILEARLWQDMMPLRAQVQRASDTAKFAAVRVGQVSNVPMPDRETTFDALQGRIAATVSFLESVPPSAFLGRESTEVILPAPSGQRVYTGRTYLLEFALPNFFFHTTTAYDLLRHAGVPIGKADYLGWR